MSPATTSAWSRFLTEPREVPKDFPAIHSGETVLITGAGGYIGSALSRAIAQGSPRHVVLLDSCEQNLFEIGVSLEAVGGRAAHVAVLGSAGNQKLVENLLARFSPDIIYHAAAFKHVPLLEGNPFAAIENNSIETYSLIQTARRCRVPNLVVISTDKAVNPASILGASKRIAELAAVSLSDAECRMNAIRLVNVIGSPGSVTRIFEQQIKTGGDLTVTHADATRWFLPLHETVNAILAAGKATRLGAEGRIFVPEAGHPVKIVDLARALLDAADRKVPIAFTGLRPGDKLSEELASSDEVEEGCVEGLLRVIQTRRMDPETLRKRMQSLSGAVADFNLDRLMEGLNALVPDYRACAVAP